MLIEVIRELDVDARDIVTAVVLDRGDYLVDDFRGVGFGANHHFEAVGLAFSVLARDALESDVRVAVLHFLKPGRNARAAREVDICILMLI